MENGTWRMNPSGMKRKIRFHGTGNAGAFFSIYLRIIRKIIDSAGIE